MTRLNRIITFLDDYKTLTPELQKICSTSQKDYIRQLHDEWISITNHPFPNEYQLYQSDTPK